MRDTHQSDFEATLARKGRRRRAADRRGDDHGWSGLGMMGLVGWSFSIPVLLSLALGIWIDTNRQTAYSWALMLLAVGVVLGAVNVWFWISSERKRIERDHNDG